MSPQSFDILDPTLNLYQKFFVEASAGCGKTFSIENAYLRLLLNPERPMTPLEVLVLTFTREATKELRMRTRRAIENALFELENPTFAKLPYILEILEKDEVDIEKAQRALHEALANFDQAQIFTLHGFCFRMLKENFFSAKIGVEESFDDEGPEFNRIERAIRDFLSFELSSSYLSSSQFRLLLKNFRGDFSSLLKKMLMELSKERATLAGASFNEESAAFFDAIEALTLAHPFEKQKVLSDAQRSAAFYKGGHSRSKEMYPELKEAIKRFCNLFESEDPIAALNSFLWHSDTFLNHFNGRNRKRTLFEMRLYYPELWEGIDHTLAPLLKRMTSSEYLLSKLIAKARGLYERVLQESRALTPNKILENFRELVQNERVAGQIAQRYEAVIVDEFQDTDPLQWEILSSIFLKHREADHPFYLVGDPKQSIYAFRSADIYTYLAAAKSLGKEAHRTLGTNYRSQPKLIDGLNALFQKKNPNWIELPKLEESLIYQPVESSSSKVAHDFQDDRASVQFFSAFETRSRENIPSTETEQKRLFPYIVEEVLRIHLEEGVPLSQFALLVKDRFQADRLKKYLKAHHIPFKSSRAEPLKGTQVAEAFLEVYESSLDPKRSGRTPNLKLNPFFPLYRDEEDLQEVMRDLLELRIVLMERGFLAYYEALMTKDFQGLTLFEHLLSLEEGIYVYQELEQIKDLMVQEEMKGHDAKELLLFLQSLAQKNSLFDQELSIRQHLSEDALNILTLHMSKGLEYDIVFALGLANRTLSREDLIPYEKEGESLLVPKSYCSQTTLAHEKEINAEKLRQLYVAMTRAKQRLYVPIVWAKAVEERKSAPIELFLSKLGLDPKGLKAFIDSEPNLGLSEIKENLVVSHSYRKVAPNLTPPGTRDLTLSSNKTYSFTALQSKDHTKVREILAPSDFEAEEKTIHTLPAGSETGILYHSILEKIDFQEKEINLDSFLENTPYHSWKNVIEEHIQEILSKPLLQTNPSFCLRDLKADQIFREIEFLYPIKRSLSSQSVIREGDQMQGVIDLACCFENKYYLIDYKTNWLGPSDEDYSCLADAMKEHDYGLQAEIYKQAFSRYLKVFEKRPFDECFGGTIYLFLRGINNEKLAAVLLS